MTFETKEEILEKLIDQKKPNCPHCGQEMKLWEVPPINVGDGLGWGTPYLYLCFNDDCPLYVSGWENMRENFGRNSSYRCFCYPNESGFECMPVFSPMGASGQAIDDQVMMEQEMLKEAIKRGFSILADCYNDKDGVTVLRMLTDSSEPTRVRLKAAEMIGDIGELEAIEPLRALKFGNRLVQDKVDESIKKIHGRFFTRECPFCAEVIKIRAKVCKHCGQDVAGQ
jgi:RNA polymerase subunit RPABC4/transcription elongation factor Spt4